MNFSSIFLGGLLVARNTPKTFNDFGLAGYAGLDPERLETFVRKIDSRWVEKIIKKLFNEARKCDIGFYERARLTVPGNANGTVFNSHGIRDGKFRLVLHCAGILMLSTRELKKGKNRFAENWMRMGERRAQSFGYPLDGFATLMEFTPTLALLCSDIGEPAFYEFSPEFLVLQPHSRSRASCDRWKGFGFMSCWGTLLIIIFSTGTLPISKPCWKEW